MIRFFILVFLFVVATPAFATHIVGGQMTYSCSGGNQYHITLSVYRDCNCTNCADFDFAAPIAIWLDGTLYYSTSVEGDFDNQEEILPLVTPCMIPPDVCVERLNYEFDIVLPVSTSTYTVVYQRCCRASTAENINVFEIGASYTIDITPEAQAVCNSSPTFEEVPPTAICAGLPFIYDHSAIDSDGDSLVYYFCPLVEGGGSEGTNNNPGDPSSCNGISPNPPCAPIYDLIPYAAPYTTPFPMGGNPLLSIDSLTGLITGTPIVQGIFVVGVCINEYRNDTLLSISQRECQFDVVPCQNAMNAALQGTITLGTYTLENCGTFLDINNISSPTSGISTFIWQIVTPSNDTLVFDGDSPLDNTFDLSAQLPELGVYSGVFYLNPDQPWCADSLVFTVEINVEPTAQFEFSYDTCVAGPVVFADLSTEGDTTLTQWNWLFEPAGTGNTQNPSFLFSEPGVLPVQLIVTDANGCKDTVINDITWYPVPPTIILVPDITLGCAPQPVFFENLSAPLNDDYTLEWEFGDGGTGSGVSPTHVYPLGGVYDVSVHITSPEGCETDSVFTGFITVQTPPQAIFTAVFDSCVAGPVTFNESCLAGDWPLSNWSWQYGNGQSSNLLDHNYNYPVPGEFDVRLIIADTYGCKDTAYQNIIWLPAPAFIEASYVLPSGCAPLEVSFQNNSYPTNVQYQIDWDFGNDSVGTGNNSSTTYPLSGTYDVSVSIVSPIGCVIDTVFTDFIKIFQGPTADFEFVYDTCVRSPIVFNQNGILGDTILTAWFWDLGAGFTSDVDSFAFLYPQPGDYPLSLIIEDGNGCRDTADNNLSWYPIPEIILDLSTLDGCAPESVFFGNSIAPIDSNYLFFWDFGNGSTSVLPVDTVIYLVGGIYTVTLQLQSPNGCIRDSVFQDIIPVRVVPEAAFSYTPDSISSLVGQVQFLNTTLDSTNAWNWNIDNQYSSILENPTYQFANTDTGWQRIALYVTHINGCRDSVVGFVDVVPEITFFMPNAFSPNEDGENEFYLGKGLTFGMNSFELTVFDRWGQTVYQSNDWLEAWNGRENNTGRACEVGVYYYKIRYKRPRGQIIEYRDKLTLVR